MDMEKESINGAMYDRQISSTPSSLEIGHIELQDIRSSIKPDFATRFEITKPIRRLLIEKETKKNVHLWTISNCADITEALDLFDSETLVEESKNDDTVLMINVCIDDYFVDLNSREIRDLNKKFREEAVVILLTSKSGGNFSLFWKSKKIEYFLELKQYTQKLLMEDERIICEFLQDFLTTSLESGHLGLHSDFSSSTNAATKVEMHLLANKNDQNLLLIAAQSGNAKAVKVFLKLGLNPYSKDNSISAQSLALANEHYDVLLILLQSNLTYPDTIDLNKCPEELKKFIMTSLNLHKSIKDGDCHEVDKIVSRKHSRHFYNLSNESAPKVAIENKKIGMYEKLLVKKVLFSPHENVTDIMGHLNYDDKKYIHEVHYKHSIDMPEKHINTLVANSYVGHEEVSNVEDKLDYIKNAFKILNEIPLIRIILKVVAAARKFRIIFDFNRDSAEFVDPTVDSNTVGVFYPSGRIFIGARQLLRESTKHLTLATMAHELCHFAMNLVFQNHARPYTTKDNLLMQEAENVSKICQSQQGKEEIVDLVYQMYPEDRHHAELIVRAPHIIVHYVNNPAKMKDLKQVFEPLFNLYENQVVPKMEKALPDIESRFDKELAKKDKEISNLKKILLSSLLILIALTTSSIYYAYQKKGKSYEFNELEYYEKEIVWDFNVIYENVPVKFSSIFERKSAAYTHLDSNIYKDIITGKKNSFDFSTKKFEHLEPHVEFNWSELTEPLKEKFLNSTCNFQGANVLFSEFYSVYNETFQNLTSKMIKMVLKTGFMTVGLPIPDVPKQCVERKFVPKNNTLYQIGFKDLLEPDLVFILSDNGGTGKTATFKQFGKYVKQVNPLRWVTFVETRIFEENSKTCKNIDRMFGLETAFDKAVFLKACDTKNAVILWDSYEDHENNELTSTLKEFHNTHGNNLLFNTRPGKNELELAFKKTSNIFVPLDEDEQMEFIKCQMKLMKGEVSEDIVNKKVQSFFLLLNHLHNKSRGSQLTSGFTTPFVLKLIASDYILREDKNLYELYMKILDEMLKTLMEKEFSDLNLMLLKSEANLIDIFEKFALNYEKSLLFYKIHLKMINLNIFQSEKSENLELIKKLPIEDFILDKTFVDFFIAKYLLNSIYDKRTCGYTDEEIELRLELFFYYVRVYRHNQWLLTEFSKDYLKVESRKYNVNNTFNFCPNVQRVLQTKFSRIFIDLLGTDQPEVFEFLIRFFGNDKKVLKMLLHIDQNVTFYDEIFNIVNNAYYINPENILKLVDSYLIDEDRIGNNGNESFYVSSYFYRKSSVPKIHKNARYLNFSNDSDVCDIISLSEKQWIALLESPLSSVILIDEVLQKTSESAINLNNFPNNESLCPILPIYWRNVNKLIDDKIKFFGNEISNYFQVSASNTYFQNHQILKILLKKTEWLLNPTSIHKMIIDFNLLHKAAENFQNYKIIWEFIEKHIVDAQDRKMIIMKDAEGMYKYDHYAINGTIDKRLTYRTRYFEKTPLKPFHIALLSSNNTKYMDFIMKSHKSILKFHEIVEIIKTYMEFLYDFVMFSELDYCLHLAKYFKNEEDSFAEYLKDQRNSTYLKYIVSVIHEGDDRFPCALKFGFPVTSTFSDFRRKSHPQERKFLSYFCND